jgi:hypothetical protein
MSSQRKREREIAREKLEGYRHRTELKTFEDVLSLEELPESDAYGLSCALEQIYSTCLRTLVTGIDAPDKTFSWVVKNIERVRAMLNAYVCRQYRQLRDYNMAGQAARWNTATLIFTIRCLMLVILDGMDDTRVKKTVDTKHLIDLGLVMYATPPLEYTQMQLKQTLNLLATRWYSLEYHINLQDWVSLLEYRFAVLSVGRHSGAVLDGKEGIDKNRTVDKPRQYSCSAEYVADMSSMLCVLLTSFYLRGYMAQNFIKLGANWKGHKLVPGFVKWLVQESEVLKGVKFKDEMKRSLFTIAGMRPGDIERYVRDNAGLAASDPITVIEHSRTPLQSSWWNTSATAGGIPVLIRSRDPLARAVTVAKVFHRCCESRMQFSWWVYCLYLEKDIVQKKDDISIQNQPVIVQQLGEWNVYYHNNVYRTVTIENAIVLWALSMIDNKDCMFEDNTLHVYDLGKLRAVVKEWEDCDAPKEAPRKDEMEGIMTEVIDPEFL